jgi:hypothetical protein
LVNESDDEKLGVTLLPAFDCEEYSALDSMKRQIEIEVTTCNDVIVVASPNDVPSSIDRQECLTLHVDNDGEDYPCSVTLEIDILLFKAVETFVSSKPRIVESSNRWHVKTMER